MNRITRIAAAGVLAWAGVSASAAEDARRSAPPPSHAPASDLADPSPREPQDRDSRRDRDRDLSLSDAEIELAIVTFREIDPQAARDFEERRRTAPDDVGRHIRRHFPRIRDFLALKQLDPPMFDLRVRDFKLFRESKELARDIVAARNTDDDARVDELTDRLHTLAEQHFDVRQQIRQRELEKLEAQIERLRDQLEERADEKDDLIEDRVASLIDGKRADW